MAGCADANVDARADRDAEAVERGVSDRGLEPGVLPVGIAAWPFVTAQYPIRGVCTTACVRLRAYRTTSTGTLE